MIPELPLFLFTSLVGTAAAAYLASVAFSTERFDAKKTAVFTLAMLVLLGVGSMAVMGHLHHPERVLNALANPLSSLTQEAYGAGALGILMAVDLVVYLRKKAFARPLRIVGAVVAAVLVCVMAHAYFTMYGNLVFAALPTLPFFAVCTLAVGFALVGIVFPQVFEAKGAVVGCAVLQVLSAASLFWEAAHSAQCGFAGAPAIVGGVLALVAAVATYAIAKKPENAKPLAAAAFAAALVGVLIARYAFYAVGLYVI